MSKPTIQRVLVFVARNAEPSALTYKRRQEICPSMLAGAISRTTVPGLRGLKITGKRTGQTITFTHNWLGVKEIEVMSIEELSTVLTDLELQNKEMRWPAIDARFVDTMLRRLNDTVPIKRVVHVRSGYGSGGSFSVFT